MIWAYMRDDRRVIVTGYNNAWAVSCLLYRRKGLYTSRPQNTDGYDHSVVCGLVPYSLLPARAT